MSIISRLTTVAAAGAGGYAFSYWPVSISQSTAANTVTVTSYAADTGLIGSQVLSMPVRTVGAYTSYYFSADGNYFIFAEYESNTSSTTTSYIHVFDASGGPGTLSLLGTYSESGTYARKHDIGRDLTFSRGSAALDSTGDANMNHPLDTAL